MVWRGAAADAAVVPTTAASSSTAMSTSNGLLLSFYAGYAQERWLRGWAAPRNSPTNAREWKMGRSLATGFGAIFVVLIMDIFRQLKGKNGVEAVLAFSLGMASGVMISVSVVDLWFPLVTKDGLVLPTCFVLAGFGVFYGISKALSKTTWYTDYEFDGNGGILPLHHSDGGGILPPPSESASTSADDDDDRDNSSTSKPPMAHQQRNLRVTAMMFLALTLHNFPEGLAVSVSASASDKLGLVIAIAVAFHNAPEGAVIAAPCYHATKSKRLAIGLAFLSGLSEPFGALVSIVVLGPFLQAYPSFVPYVLCVVAGIMLGSSALELLPESLLYHRPGVVLAGFCFGTATMLGTIWWAET